MKKKEKRRATTFLKKKYLQKKKIVGHLNFEHSSKNYNSIIFIGSSKNMSIGLHLQIII